MYCEKSENCHFFKKSVFIILIYILLLVSVRILINKKQFEKLATFQKVIFKVFSFFLTIVSNNTYT